MTGQRDANRTAIAAGAEAGTHAADSIAVTCDLLRFGVFFDGTGNSRDHASTGDISWRTNVDLLEFQYDDTRAPEVRKVAGKNRTVNYGKLYMRGIGVDASGGMPVNGAARGMGPEGVRQRVDQAMGRLRNDIRTKANGMEVCDLWFDAFGFSRGAAAARHFANQVKDGTIGHPNANARVKFLGLYDTVVMVGTGVDTTGADDNVNVRTTGVADKIVHITAKDEIRENFPLTLATGGTRHRMVGVHSDIGGGYEPGVNTGSFEFEHEDYPGLVTYLNDNWGLTPNTVGADTGSRDTMVSVRQSAWQPQDRGEWLSTFNWRTSHGLQFVSLRLMFDEAAGAGVPVKTWNNSIDGVNVSLNETLLAYFTALKAGSATAAQERAIRLRYAHVSFNGNRSWGFQPNLPRVTGNRLVATR